MINKEGKAYMHEANVAVLLEKKYKYQAAAQQWEKASALAATPMNRHWATARAEFCNHNLRNVQHV